MTLVIEKAAPAKTVPWHDDALAQPRFSTAEISRATGVPTETIRTWFKRGVLSLSDDSRIGEEAEGIGLGRKFSGYLAMVIAILGRLTAGPGGISAELAKKAAYKFVFAGTDGRLPCMIFPEGETVLVIPKSGRAAYMPDILRVDGAEIALSAFQHVEVLPLTELWQGVFQTLGLRAELEKRWG